MIKKKAFAKQQFLNLKKMVVFESCEEFSINFLLKIRELYASIFHKKNIIGIDK